MNTTVGAFFLIRAFSGPNFRTIDALARHLNFDGKHDLIQIARSWPQAVNDYECPNLNFVAGEQVTTSRIAAVTIGLLDSAVYLAVFPR